jgi:hypothetical protein
LKQRIFFAVDYILPCFWPWFGQKPTAKLGSFLAL